MYWKRTVRNFSKGGKQRIGDTAYQGMSSSRLKELYGKAKGKEKQRIKKELKNRGEANNFKEREKVLQRLKL